MGVVDRMIWWKDTETMPLKVVSIGLSLTGEGATHNETFEMAIFTV